MSDQEPIGWIREIVLDCPDPWALARFWAGLLGGEPAEWYPGWVTIEPPPHGQRLSFQATAAPPSTAAASTAPPSTAPATGGAARAAPLLAHFDVLVAGLTAAHERVIAAGAAFQREHVSPRPGPAGEPVRWRVYTDPAGQPFCLVTR